jgi:hypothetical protein
VAQELEQLPSKHEALSSNSVTVKKKKGVYACAKFARGIIIDYIIIECLPSKHKSLPEFKPQYLQKKKKKARRMA